MAVKDKKFPPKESLVSPKGALAFLDGLKTFEGQGSDFEWQVGAKIICRTDLWP